MDSACPVKHLGSACARINSPDPLNWATVSSDSVRKVTGMNDEPTPATMTRDMPQSADGRAARDWK